MKHPHWCALLLPLFCAHLLAAPGDPDLSFNIGAGFSGPVHAIHHQADGHLLVVGNFATVNNIAHANLVRLSATGQSDITFQPITCNNTVEAVAVQADGKVVIGGSFTQINGVTRNRLARLHADGTLDLTFDPGAGFNNTVRAVVVQADGRILVGGHFTHYQGVNQPYLVRLLASATLDASYAIGGGRTTP